jgi:hypothetical protein
MELIFLQGRGTEPAQKEDFLMVNFPLLVVGTVSESCHTWFIGFYCFFSVKKTELKQVDTLKQGRYSDINFCLHPCLCFNYGTILNSFKGQCHVIFHLGFFFFIKHSCFEFLLNMESYAFLFSC